VSDQSIRSISLHLGELREISVRGCGELTKAGVETLCLRNDRARQNLEKVDLSLCRNFCGGSQKWWESVSRNGKVKFIL